MLPSCLRVNIINLFLLVLNIVGYTKSSVNTIYYNGSILTMNDLMPTVDAVVISNGRIEALGTMEDVSKYINNNTLGVNLYGKTLMPGFIDSHGHISAMGLQQAVANLYPEPDGNCKSIQDIVDMMYAYYKTDPLLFKESGVLTGFGYDDTQLKELRHPTKFDLDLRFPGISVYLMHQSGHFGVANSQALQIFNITAETPDPPGGIIHRVENSSEPNGVLEEAAHMNVYYKIVNFAQPIPSILFLLGLHYIMSYGYTTVQDGKAIQKDMDVMKDLAMWGLLPIDIVAYQNMPTSDEIFNVSKEYKGRFRVGGGKLTLDGSPQAKTAWRDRPYVVPPPGKSENYSGYPTMNRDVVIEQMDRAFSKNFQVLVHANGEAAIDLLIEAVEKAERKYDVGDRRPVLIHGQFTRLDQVEKIIKLGIFPSLFPMHTFYWGEWHRNQTIGEPGVEDISPTEWFESRGVRFTVHNDAPVAPPSIFRNLWSTVNRISRKGRVIGPHQRVSVETALKAVTIWSAYQHFEENEKGSLEIGKKADMIILSENPLEIDPLRLTDIFVIQTIKEGKVVYQHH